MPTKYRKVPKVKLTTAELRVAAESIAPLAVSVAEHVTRVAVARARDRIVGAGRGRGKRLTAYEQLAVFFYAVAIAPQPREIARALGMEPRTVRRLLTSKRYERFTAAVDLQIAHTFSMRRHLLQARHFLRDVRA
jgi:hypothetical protein